jgi:DNA-binding transcriptional regulator WhiA
MRAKKIDNFKKWRDRMKASGKIKSSYKPFRKNGDLAELIGVLLGDGNIHAFPRTECLRLVSHSDKLDFIEYYSALMERVIGKKPAVRKRSTANATDIVLYEKHLSTRLNIPAGSRSKYKVLLPSWIGRSSELKRRFLRGLYEAEGSIHYHKPTYTHKLLFSNTNESMRTVVSDILSELGFHPHTHSSKVQISRKEEVQKLKNLLQFRSYI